MHRSVGKITDKNVLLFSSQTKFALQKAAIIPFNADNHVISSCGWKNGEREMVNQERSWSGVMKCSEHGGEIVGAPLHSHTLPDTATQMWLFVNDCLLQDLTQRNSSLPVTKDTVTVCQAIVVVFFIN